MSDKAPFVRLAVQLFAGVGVSKVVNDVIVNNTNIQTTRDAVKVWTGSVVIGSMITEAASRHVDEKINAVLAWRRRHQESAPVA
jgi:hypothetical protein